MADTENPFSSLIPEKTEENPFASLIPEEKETNPFSSLIPKSGRLTDQETAQKTGRNIDADNTGMTTSIATDVPKIIPAIQSSVEGLMKAPAEAVGADPSVPMLKWDATPGKEFTAKHPVVAGAIDWAQKASSAMSTPEVLPFLVAGGAGPVAEKIISTAFLSQMAVNAPESAAEVGKRLGENDVAGATSALLDYAASMIGPTMAAKGLAKPGETPPPYSGKQIPMTPGAEVPPRRVFNTPDTPVLDLPFGEKPNSDAPAIAEPTPEIAQKLSPLNSDVAAQPAPAEPTETAAPPALVGNSGQLPTTPPPDPVAPESPTTPKLTSLGGDLATGGDTGPAGQSGTPVDKMFATIAKDNVLLGKPPIPPGDPRTWSEDQSTAIHKMNTEPGWAESTIRSLNNGSKKSLLSWENIGLLMQKSNWEAEWHNSMREAQQAFDDGRKEDQIQAEQNTARFEDSLYELNQAMGPGGIISEVARTLKSQQAGVSDDLSLVQMRLEKRARVGNRPLTQPETEEISKLHSELEAAKKERDTSIAQFTELSAEKSLRDIELETLRKNPPVAPHVRLVADKWKAYFDDRRKTALAALRSGSFDITGALPHLIDLGASTIASGTIELGAWSAEMLSQLPEMAERITPYLKQIYEASKKMAYGELDRIGRGSPEGTSNRVKRLPKDAPLPEQLEDVKSRITAKQEAGKLNELTPLAQQLAKIAVQSGARGWREVNDAVHAILKNLIPDWDHHDTLQAVSGQGKFTLPKEDEVSKALADAKRQTLEVVKIQKVIGGEPVNPTGYVRPKSSDAARRLATIYNNVKRKFGLNITDPEVQLRSALQARKTWVTHRMADLKYEIDKRQRVIKTKAPSPTDPELEGMLKEYADIKAEHKAVFGDRQITDEQRMKMLISSMTKRADEYARRRAAGDFETPAKKALPETPESQSARDRLESEKAAYEELRGLDQHFQAEQERRDVESKMKSAQQSIDAIKEKLSTGNVAPKKRIFNRPSAPEQLEKLRQERDDLNRQLAAARRKTDAQKESDSISQKLKSKNKAIEDKKAQIDSGDISTKGAKVNRPLGNEALEKAQQELDALNNQLHDLRHPPKSPEERSLESFKTRIANRTADLQSQLDSGVFTIKPAKKPLTLDPEATAARGKYERVKQKYEQWKAKDKLANRTSAQKLMDWSVGWRRGGVISGLGTLGKIGIAGQTRIGMTMADTAAGKVLNKLPVLRDIAAGAPREGLTTPGSVSRMAAGYVEGWKYAINQSGKVLRTGQTDLEAAAKLKQYPPSMLSYLGNLHSLLKLPAFAQEYHISLRERTEQQMRAGVDMTDPVQQLRVSNEALQDGLRSKFSQDNFVTKRLQMGLESLEKEKIHPTAAKAIETVIRLLLPVHHVPMNWFAESATYSNLGLGLPRAAKMTVDAVRQGVDKLTPEQRDSIMRHWKKGSLGAGLMLYGYYNRNNIGGYYQPGKRDPNAPQFGGAQIFGHNIPRIALHIPIMEPINLGSTIGHVMDHLTKSTGETGTLMDGVLAGAAGLIEETPYTQGAKNIAEMLSPDARGAYARGELVKTATVPRLIEDIAKWTDPAERRYPHNPIEHVETAVPGLRERVSSTPPPKKGKTSRYQIAP